MDCNKEEATKARGITEELIEKDDVPEGSFELDPASLPTYQLGISASSIGQRATTNFMDSVNSAEKLGCISTYSVAAEPLKNGVYKIFPRTGEVWEVYKNWSAQLMKGNNLADFEYEIVEIVDVSDNYVDVKS
uniref:Heat shock protein DnaJ N-terminal domain-containing protein n=1 Tax=Solanum tuberosum TaxID=4113 RepID=M1DSQ3_SOLTU